MNTASYHNNQAIWTELLPGGHHWSGRIQKGTARNRELSVQTYCKYRNPRSLLIGYDYAKDMPA
jgi:hypothetical protein